MTPDELHQKLAAYNKAVRAAGNTDPSLSRDERWALDVAASQLAAHAPSDRIDPTCSGCPGRPWPCSIVAGAIVMSDSRYN